MTCAWKQTCLPEGQDAMTLPGHPRAEHGVRVHEEVTTGSGKRPEDSTMARNRRRPDGERPRQRRPAPPGDIPDRRAMEGLMRDLVDGLRDEAAPDTPLAQAQAIMYRA